MKRALFSLYKKDGAEVFAAYLQKKGHEIISTGGTYRYLKDKGVPVTEVSEMTGFPEVLDGRVKTLQPAVHAGILAMRGKKDHMDQLKKHKIEPIDFVVVNLYPFEETVSRPGAKLEDIIEQIDIGGVALIRAAGKNYSDVCVVVDNADFEGLMKEMDSGGVKPETRRVLAAKAFSHTAYYDSLISTWFNRQADIIFPKEFGIPMRLQSGLRYGENPHQNANLYKSYVDANISTINAEVLWGKEMSYNNYMDADAVLDIVRDFANDPSPFCAIIKHTNPCGASMGKTLSDAFSRAYQADPDAAFGGIVGVNRKMDNETAKLIGRTFYEIIIAPDYDADALETLKAKKNLRIMKLTGSDWSKKGMHYRRIEGGMLMQDWDAGSSEKFEVVSKRSPDEKQKADLLFAWKICKHVKSNGIVYAKDGQVIGVGAGQMKRVDSGRIAVLKAGEAGLEVKGSVMASDAFFPFRDTVDNAAANGVTAVIQPGGSKNDAESVAAADEHGVALVMTGVRHFKH